MYNILITNTILVNGVFMPILRNVFNAIILLNDLLDIKIFFKLRMLKLPLISLKIDLILLLFWAWAILCFIICFCLCTRITMIAKCEVIEVQFLMHFLAFKKCAMICLNYAMHLFTPL